LNRLPELGFKLEGSGLDIAGDGGCTRILGPLESIALFDMPGERADELYGLGRIAQQVYYVAAGDGAACEPLYKMVGSRVSSAVISVTDTTSLLRGESSVESAQSSGSGGR
jgi:hypothetical protein